MDKRNCCYKDIMIVTDIEKSAEIVLDCLQKPVLSNVERIGLLSPETNKDSLWGRKIVDLRTGSMENAGFYIIACKEMEDIVGDGIFNVYDYDSWWLMSLTKRYWVLQDFYVKKNDDIDSIIIGMSYLERGINIKRMSGHNLTLAAPTQDHFYDYEMYKFALREGCRFKRCIFEMNPYKLWYDLSLAKECNRVLSYLPQTGTLHHLKTDIDVVGLYKKMNEQYLSIFEDDVVKRLNQFDSEQVSFAKKKDTLMYALNRNEKESIDEIIRIFNKPYEDTFRENVELLKEWVGDMITRNIEAVLVMPPFPSIFLKYMDRSMYKRTLEVVEELKEINPSIKVLNYTESERFDDYYFSDWDHLNYFGANMLTDLIDGELTRSGIMSGC